MRDNLMRDLSADECEHVLGGGDVEDLCADPLISCGSGDDPNRPREKDEFIP